MSGLLKLSGVHTHIGRYHILQGIDLVVPQGQTTMLLGRNGAGKTTTLRTVMGLWQASSGEITLAGERIESQATPDIARLPARRYQARLDLRLLPRAAALLAVARRQPLGRTEADALDRACDRRAAQAPPH